MRIIQPEAHILPFDGDILRHVERCGRIAYKSENAITEDSYIKFIIRMLESGHESVLEHGNYVFEVSDFDYYEALTRYNMLPFDKQEYKEKGYSRRLRFSLHTGKPLVSGSIRGWRDFIRVCKLEKAPVPKWVQATFSHNLAFDDFDMMPSAKERKYNPAKREDLTPEELLIHWTETVHFVCSRAISHELVRHRALSPTQESQRYCNYSKGKFGGEITFIEPLWATTNENEAGKVWWFNMKDCEEDYLWMVGNGLQPQEAREVLPNSTKTELVMTGTLGEWKHFFGLRCADDAHPEMRRIAIPLREEFEVM